MKNNIILIAEEDGGIDVDMFDTTIPPVEETNSEIPVLPDVELPQVQSEMQTVVQKSFISFGVTGLIIVAILIAALIIKKFKTAPAPNVEYIPELTDEQEEYIQNSVQKRSTSKLSTPSSVHKCILSFLDITKEH